MRGYDATVRLHIGPTLGAVKLAELTTPMLEGWRDRLLLGSEHRKPLARRRARRVVTTLKAVLNEAQRRGLVAQNAALPVKIDAKARDSKRLEVGVDMPSKEHIQQLLAASMDGRWRRHRP